MKKIITLFAFVMLYTLGVSGQAGFVINEVDYDQPSVDSAEFIELYNGSGSAINTSDYAVLLYNGSPAGLAVYDTILLPVGTLNSGSFFVICGSGGNVPNCNMVRPNVSNMIQNGSPDAIAILSIPSLTIIDALSYEGDCPAPFIEGTGLPIGLSDTVVVDSINGHYISVGRYPDGTDSNNNSADFHRMCISPGSSNLNTDVNCAQVRGIERPDNAVSIVMYPNPSHGQLNIDFGKDGVRNATISVYNILGNELYSTSAKSISSIYSLDLSDFTNGVYFIKVSSADGESMQRILLKK
jgi:hypothetical protein